MVSFTVQAVIKGLFGSDGGAGSEWGEGAGSDRERARGRRVTGLEREKIEERDSKKEIEGNERDREGEDMHRGREKWG